jgi:DNA-binding NarL/FixJ family response regulator
MRHMRVIRVLLVEPHPLYLIGLRNTCSRDARIELVGEAGTAAHAVAAIAKVAPEVVILELDLPDGHGLSVLRECCRANPVTRALVLTGRRDGCDVYEALAAGASGFLLKTATAREVGDAAVEVAAGNTIIDTRLSRSVAAEIRLQAARAEINLTQRELDVLALVAQGCSSRDIGKRLYVSETTVKTHLARLYGKLGVTSRAAAVAQAMSRGLVNTA